MLTSLHLDSSVMAHRVSLGRESRWAKDSLSLGLGERKEMEKGTGRGKMKIEQEK